MFTIIVMITVEISGGSRMKLNGTGGQGGEGEGEGMQEAKMGLGSRLNVYSVFSTAMSSISSTVANSFFCHFSNW